MTERKENRMIPDQKAELLEQQHLWRRAAARWQTLLLIYEQEEQQIYIRKRLEYCLRRITLSERSAGRKEACHFSGRKDDDVHY